MKKNIPILMGKSCLERKFVVRLITWHPNSSVPRPWRFAFHLEVLLVEVGGNLPYGYFGGEIPAIIVAAIFEANSSASNYDRPLSIQENVKSGWPHSSSAMTKNQKHRGFLPKWPETEEVYVNVFSFFCLDAAVKIRWSSEISCYLLRNVDFFNVEEG